MPNRILRDGILSSERVNELDWPAEVFYRRLLSIVDDYGRLEYSEKLLRAKLYPLRVDAVREADISRWIAACVKAGLIVLYEGVIPPWKRYLVYLNLKHKTRTPSKCPDPPPECLQLHAIDCKGNQLHVYTHSYSESDTYSDTESNTHKARAVELPHGFPQTEKQAVEFVRAAMGRAETDFIVKTWNLAMSRGGVDDKGVQIKSWSHHIATRWKYEEERREKEKQNGNNRNISEQRNSFIGDPSNDGHKPLGADEIIKRRANNQKTV